MHWPSLAVHTLGASVLDVGLSSLPPNIFIPPHTRITKTKKLPMACTAVVEGFLTPQWGHTFAELETSFLHSLHFVKCHEKSPIQMKGFIIEQLVAFSGGFFLDGRKVDIGHKKGIMPSHNPLI
ncbi:hypothetical protein [Symbiopectobacterium sp.]|uniref:hypothetical protein n=1 Tax=Symbiopectobacterium sp. TaxID=2952789 RepID=UPI003F3A93E5